MPVRNNYTSLLPYTLPILSLSFTYKFRHTAQTSESLIKIKKMDRSGLGSGSNSGPPSRTNGNTATTANNGQSRDIYQQLIDNDMVKELDDIEAISQQISQHAEVLYNSWKNNSNNNNNSGAVHSNGVMSHGVGGGSSPTSPVNTLKRNNLLQHQQSISPSLDDQSSNPLSRDLRERGGGRSSPAIGTVNGYNTNGPSAGVTRGYTVPIKAEIRNGVDERQVKTSYPGGSSGYGSLDRQNLRTNSVPSNFSTNSLDRHGGAFNSSTSNNNGHQSFGHGRNSVSSSRNSSFSSPPSSSRESPAKGSSITHITSSPPAQNSSDVGPLELLASPNLSGNLEELVTSFVSTDRAKQAARNTISSTIMRRLGSPSPSGTSSPVRSPSPSSSSYFGASPLRSPMLTNSLRSMTSPDPQVSSPKPSIASMFPSDFNTNLDSVHAPMQSIFGSSENGMKPLAVRTPVLQSPPSVRSPISQSMGQFNQPLVTREPYFNPSPFSKPNKSADVTDSVPIPVKIVPSPSSSQGLKSPSVLQHVNNNNNGSNGNNNNNHSSGNKPANPFQFPIVSNPSVGSVGATSISDEPHQHTSMPNLFDPMGKVKDADDNIKAMRQRFEEAKQRMALSLPAREGGLRPNSLIARSMFDDSKFNNSWSDDGSFLLDQLRRRHKRRMETPAAPHPELTPQQRQHISERTATAAATPGSQLLTGGMPARRGMHPGGSVAERVLMFEKSPSVIGMEPGQARIVPIRREPTLTGTALTPWKSQQHYEQQVSCKLILSFI